MQRQKENKINLLTSDFPTNAIDSLDDDGRSLLIVLDHCSFSVRCS